MGRGPRQLAVTFGVQNLTHYGGIYLLHRFLSRVGFKHGFTRCRESSVSKIEIAIFHAGFRFKSTVVVSARANRAKTSLRRLFITPPDRPLCLTPRPAK